VKLSIIIVNYNVKYFLEQCLHSLENACKGLETEIFVVDNNSVDGSIKMVREKFPEVILIENKDNRGFSKANNQAIRKSKGEYILLLNPDTLLEDNTLRQSVTFMDEHPDAGGLGVKMIDGKGKFLPESKRSLPSPSVAFFKIFGFSALFPRSKTFNRYHLGYLDRDQTHQVDVLAGAFMMLRKKVIDEVGLLDENFFMYGEDVDLSYRIIQAGYKNYYFPDARIIHYKGESTKKSSINYVFMFYNAMIIFARKHYSQKNARAFSIMIHLAIYFRAFLSILTRFAGRIFLPTLDFLFTFAGIYLIKGYWEHDFIFPEGGHYPPEFIQIMVPVYLVIWILCVYLSGGYERPIRLLRILQGMAIGTVIILVIYSLLSENFRFSRAMILLGAAWGTIAMLALRGILHLVNPVYFGLNSLRNKRFVIIGEKEEAKRVADLLQKTGMTPEFVGLVSYHSHRHNTNGFLGHIGQIKEIINIHKINELIFCARDIPAQVIMDQMSELKDALVDYKIAPPESLSIIGSNSINTSGDLYVIEINAIIKKVNRRNKRLLDFLVSLILLLTSPVSVWLVRNPPGLLQNIFRVLFARRSWVGYASPYGADNQRLPEIRKGILSPLDAFRNKGIPDTTTDRLNLLYARDYKVQNDILIILQGFRSLGRVKQEH